MEINVHRSRVTKVEVAMKIKERMVKLVTVCGPEDNLAEVTAMMWDNRCGVLPVVDNEERVISMITDRDICIALGTRNLRASDVYVRDVAPPRVFACLDSDDISFALRTMVAQNVRRLPVVNDEGKLVGVISIDDFLLHTERGKGGVLSLEALEALKTIIENRQRCHTHEPAEMLAANV
jgi:CBS domain-containing protein